DEEGDRVRHAGRRVPSRRRRQEHARRRGARAGGAEGAAPVEDELDAVRAIRSWGEVAIATYEATGADHLGLGQPGRRVRYGASSDRQVGVLEDVEAVLEDVNAVRVPAAKARDREVGGVETGIDVDRQLSADS